MNQETTNHGTSGQLGYATFSALVKTRFRVRADAASRIELELTHVRQIQPARPPVGAGPAAQNECFSLLFNGPAFRFLDQGTYELEHDQMGQFSLFMVPVGKNQQGFQYEAVFNRLV
jgi:hypothetical protein